MADDEYDGRGEWESSDESMADDLLRGLKWDTERTALEAFAAVIATPHVREGVQTPHNHAEEIAAVQVQREEHFDEDHITAQRMARVAVLLECSRCEGTVRTLAALYRASFAHILEA